MCELCQKDQTLFSHKEKRLARKDHRCLECGRVIARGQKYLRMAGRSLFSGFWSSVMCLYCDSDWRRIWEIYRNAEELSDYCCFLGNLAENVGNAVEMGLLDPHDELAVRWLGDPDESHPHYFCPDDRQMQLPLFAIST